MEERTRTEQNGLITEELRDWMGASTHNTIGTELIMGSYNKLLTIADRIDEQYDRTCMALDSAWSATSHAVLEQAIDELSDEYVKLPVDADGVPIHIGDVMEGVDKYDSLKNVMGKVITVSFESDGIVEVAVRAWSSDGKSWHRAYLDSDASVYRHYHEPTVEDVLREFAYGLGVPVADSYVAATAAKLRLAEEDE